MLAKTPDLSASAVQLMREFETAETIVIERIKGSKQYTVTVNGEQVKPGVYNFDFAKAFGELVSTAPEAQLPGASRIVIQRVAPPCEFTSPNVHRLDFFNIRFEDASGAKLGRHDTLKNRDTTARIFAMHLSPAG